MKSLPSPRDSLSLFLLFTFPFRILWHSIFFFFHLCVRECMVCFPFFWFLLIGENVCVSKHNDLVNSVLSKKSFYSLFSHSLFEKWKSPCSKVHTMESSWKWCFSTFKAFISIQISLCQKTWNFTVHFHLRYA